MYIQRSSATSFVWAGLRHGRRPAAADLSAVAVRALGFIIE